MNSSTTYIIPPDFAAKILEKTAQDIIQFIPSLAWPLLKTFLSPVIPTIIIAIVLLVVFIVFIAMTLGRPFGSNGLSPATNRWIGSVSYFIVHGAIIWICWNIWGLGMIDEGIFWMLQVIAFMSVRIILLWTGIWVY